MKPQEIRMIHNTDPAVLKWMQTTLEYNGFIIRDQKVIKKWFIPKYIQWSVYFFPSDEIIKRWIRDFEATEQYEQAKRWKDVLESRHGNNQN